MDIEKIDKLMDQSMFLQAYELISSALLDDTNNKSALRLSYTLSAAVRSRCHDLAANKATEMSPEAYETEALLRIIIRLNGETAYG